VINYNSIYFYCVISILIHMKEVVQ